nr:multi antimicrobial extrusion protein [Tanacetum cinerariifolium]
LWEFVKLSAASGVMLCLENWYYRILILMTAFLKDATIAIDAVSICMNINGWEMMIPIAFFAGVGVRVANELGAGNGKGAKFATIVAILHSTVIGLVFFKDMAWLLGFTILLNSIQPVISGVAVGSGWQSWVAYINLGSYYLVGVPVGVVFGLVLHLGVEGIWGGMIFGGTALQTIILGIMTIRCDWENEAQKAAAKYSTLT